MLKEKGYSTACVGKWHLGLSWTLKDGGTANTYEDEENVDFTIPVSGGPTDHGFDSWFGISASLDMPPYVYVQDKQATSVPKKSMDALEKHGLTENTIVIFTADNGCSPMADFEELATFGHNPSYVYRGHKADIFEGGHRIPFIMRWPAKVKAGSASNLTLCLTDLTATMAEITGYSMPENAAEDSVSNLTIWDGTAIAPVREATVHHSINGSFSIRKGKWKLVMCPDSGGWSDPKPNSEDAKTLPLIQLYDISADIGETTNVQDKHPEVVEELKAILTKYVQDGRSTPGAKQKNTGKAYWEQLRWLTEADMD